MSKSRYRVIEPTAPHFLTCTLVGWMPLFARPEVVQVILDSWRFLQGQSRLTLHGFVIMENHLHLIASSEHLAKEVAAFKSYTARQIIDGLEARNDVPILAWLKEHRELYRTDREHQFWEIGSHPQAIMTPDMMRQKLDYIHNNPVRRGYVDAPEHWRYSSARNYAGQPGLLNVNVDW